MAKKLKRSQKPPLQKQEIDRLGQADDMDPSEEARKKEAFATLKSGFGRELLLAAAHYVSAIFWAQYHLDAQKELNHGSIFFLECGGPPLAVTADHVYAKYWRRKQCEPKLICQIDNLPFIPEERLIGRDQDLDIAIFHI